MAQLSTLMEGGKETVIGELEALAVSMALLLWAKHLDSTQLLVYIDNEGSRYSRIKGVSASHSIIATCVLAATTWIPSMSCLGLEEYLRFRSLQIFLHAS